MNNPHESAKNYSDDVMAASQSPKLMVLVQVRFGVQKC